MHTCVLTQERLHVIVIFVTLKPKKVVAWKSTWAFIWVSNPSNVRSESTFNCKKTRENPLLKSSSSQGVQVSKCGFSSQDNKKWANSVSYSFDHQTIYLKKYSCLQAPQSFYIFSYQFSYCDFITDFVWQFIINCNILRRSLVKILANVNQLTMMSETIERIFPVSSTFVILLLY